MMDPNLHRLFIVSNRLPVSLSVADDKQIKINMSSGGLVSGLREVHSTRDSLWVGHSGLFPGDEGYEQVNDILEKENLTAVELKKKDYQAYYFGFSNNAIWPLFHYFSSAMKYSESDYRAYTAVNAAFADRILDLAKPGDHIWVHDYQLMLLPKMLRDARPDLRIAYFHHIPFPSSEIFRTIPHREDILEGILGAEYIGFHTFDYARHFLSACSRIAGHDVHVDEIVSDGRRSKVGIHPLGVDFPGISSLSASLPPPERDQLLFVGIDRLDYTKGIIERLTAFRDFLRMKPEYVGKATFVQLCVPSRTEIASYGNLKSNVERIVGRINGEFATPGYTPIQYLYRSLPFDEVIKLYKAADVAVVTPLRDGLNLVCKEYVAAKTDNDGVLILSEFAGAAAEMGEALIVNPYDVRLLAKAMVKAATMPIQERKKRMSILRDRCSERTNVAWAKSFLESWNRAFTAAQPESIRLKGEARGQLVQKIAAAERCFLFLDNDGTLTPIAARPELAVPSADILNLLRSLNEFPQIISTIVTGRPRSYCDEHFGSMPVNMVAEHGAFVREKGDHDWQSQLGMEEYNELLPDILNLFNMYTRFVPGTHIEQKETCLVWHYRQADPELAKMQARELSNSLQDLLGQTSLSVFHGKKSLEIRQVFSNKGYAVEYILERYQHRPEEPFVTIGDDVTDEDMHRIHAAENISIHVGKPNVFCKYYLFSVEEVVQFLTELRDALRARQQ